MPVQQLHHRLRILFDYSIIKALFRLSPDCLDCLITCEDFSLFFLLSIGVDLILQLNHYLKRWVELEEMKINFSFKSFAKSCLYCSLGLGVHLNYRSH